jgi:hypothetical protein
VWLARRYQRRLSDEGARWPEYVDGTVGGDRSGDDHGLGSERSCPRENHWSQSTGDRVTAEAKRKVIKRTFSNSQQITTPTSGQAAPYPSELSARGFKRGKIRDVNLTLKILSHTYPSDVDVLLSYRGVARTVMSDVGGSFDVANITLKLDDEAASLLPVGNQLSGGKFLPTNEGIVDTFPAPAPTPIGFDDLAGFDGRKANGTWRLWVMDDVAPDGGRFGGGWSITIKAKVRRR